MGILSNKVISASRRLDMVAGYPDELARLLASKCPPESVHTLVLWTKNGHNLLTHVGLQEQLQRYDQIYLHYSITGLGGTILEPNVPDPQTALTQLPRLIQLVNEPARIRIRFDPIVHIQTQNGAEICNLDFFKILAPCLERLGLVNVSTSWMQVYNKVKRRLLRHGLTPAPVSMERRVEEQALLSQIAQAHGLCLHGCCVPEWPRSKCIDGELFNTLHPKGHLTSTKRARGQRPSCGCTESWDIGWYLPCMHGCVYCYANPCNTTGGELAQVRQSLKIIDYTPTL